MNFSNLINKAKERNIEALEVYFQKTEGMSIDLFNDEIDQYTIANTQGLSVRGIYNGKMGYVGLEKVSEDNFDFILDKLIENASVIEKTDVVKIYDGKDEYEVDTKQYTDFSNIDANVKIDLLREIKNITYKLDERITCVEASYSEKAVEVELVNSYGLNLQKQYSYAVVRMSVVMEQNGESKSGYDYVVLNSLDFDKNELCERCVSDLAKSLNPGKLESGVYSVLIKNSVMQSFIGCFLSSFSGLAAKNRTSPLIGKIGQKIGNDLINFVDLPLDERAHFSQTFDDEGVKTFNKTIVEKGVFKTFMHNQETASFFNTTSTGNGFKNGLFGKVGVSPTNFSLEPMDKSFDELVELVGNGVYLTSIAGMHAGVNPISGAFSLQSSGFVIENGKITKPVTLFVVSGNFFDLLKNVEYIGSDFKYGLSSIGSASVVVKLDIAG